MSDRNDGCHTASKFMIVISGAALIAVLVLNAADQMKSDVVPPLIVGFALWLGCAACCFVKTARNTSNTNKPRSSSI